MTFQVELVSPEGIAYSGEAEMVIARTVGGGEIAFQPGTFRSSACWLSGRSMLSTPRGSDTLAVHRGFVQVAGTKVSILSDVSEASGEIDVDRARAAREVAEAALAADRDDAAAAEALARAEVRLTVAGADS